MEFDLAVIGEGVAGLTAANLASKAGLRTASFEGELFGGLVISVNELDPAPEGWPHSGVELASALAMDNMELGVESFKHAVETLTACDGAFEFGGSGTKHRAHAVIVASGAKLRALGIPGESEFEGRGVSHCADCDGPLFSGATVTVVGAGDSALQEALVLAGYCETVHLVYRGDRMRGRRNLVDRVLATPAIKPMAGTIVVRIEGNEGVEAVFVRPARGGEEIALNCAAVFPYIGLAPNTDFVPSAVVRDARGHLETDEGLETALRGVWAIGAVRARFPGQLCDAIDDAQRAVAGVAARVR